MVECAIRYSKYEVIQLFVARGFELTDDLLEFAAQNASSECVRWLKRQGLRFHKDEKGRSALHRAAIKENLKIMRKLLAAGEDPFLRDNVHRVVFIPHVFRK